MLSASTALVLESLGSNGPRLSASSEPLWVFFPRLGISGCPAGQSRTLPLEKTSPEEKPRLFKITADGKYVPLNPGCREPNSVGISPDGDVFVTDNQGSYVPSGVLNHAEPGAFLGHPDGLMFDKRSAWCLTAIASAETPTLADIEIAVMGELPTTRMAIVDRLWVEGDGPAMRRRKNLYTGENLDTRSPPYD